MKKRASSIWQSKYYDCTHDHTELVLLSLLQIFSDHLRFDCTALNGQVLYQHFGLNLLRHQIQLKGSNFFIRDFSSKIKLFFFLKFHIEQELRMLRFRLC